MALIEGGPGIGKTALLDLACALGTEQGLEVLRVLGAEFGPTIQMASTNGRLGSPDHHHGSLPEGHRPSWDTHRPTGRPPWAEAGLESALRRDDHSR